MSRRSTPARPGSCWAAAARIGLTAWFFGNLYEGLVGIPQLLADARAERTPGLLGPGSPVRYYVPAVPLVLGATVATVARSWRAGGDRRMATATAGSVATATALSGYLIRTVNVPLLTSGEALTGHERRRLVATWHRTNAIRLAALAGAMTSLSRLDQGRP